MRRYKALLFVMAASASLISALDAEAQTQPTPPEHYTLDPRGVDLVTGRFAYQATEVVIGQPGSGGIVHSRVWANGGWRDTLSGTIAVDGNIYVVSLGPISEVFIKSGSTFTSASNNGSTLVETTSALLTFTTSDGTVATYSTTYNGSTTPYEANNAALMSVTQPTGEILSFYWDGYSYCRQWDLDPFTGEPGQCYDWANAVRLDGVGNNRGYLVDFLYAAEDIPLGSQPTDWLTRTAAVGINRAVDYCDPYAPCTLSRNWPSVTYTAAGFGGGDPVEVTDQSSRTTTYTYGGFGLSGIRLPGSISDDRSVTYGTGGRVASVTDASGTWTYAYSDVGTTRTTTVTGPLNQELVVVSDQTIGRATSVTDALSNTTSYQYANGRLTRITAPEGNYTEYDYDTRGNVVEVIAVPKSGSGLSNQTVTMTYPGSCSGSYTTANCNKPLTVEDPRGNVTTYAWSSSHGGPTSITSPAVNGVNAQTRYAYAAFSAYYKNSVGNIVASASAVTLPIEVSACATADDTTGCDGTADEVLTTVAYGSTGVANNLLPTQVAQGSGASPNMAVTAMTYSPNGDIETVDGPLSGSGDTTQYRYDDARQMVGVVGPDPDGTGAALNRAQRMTYNLRGQVTLAEQGTTTGYSDTQWAAFVTLQKAGQTYDGYGRPTRSEMQAADGTVHAMAQVSYDAAGRPECQAVRMNPTVFGTVTSNACVAGTTGSFGPDRIVRATYDDVSRPVSTTSAYGLTEAITESVTYTDNGLPETLTDGEGNVSIVEYDGFDRAAKLRYPNATGGGTSTSDYATWAYDEGSNVTEYRNRSGQTFETGYDALNRPSLYIPPTLDSRTLEHDNLGRLTDLYTTGSFAWNLTWTYDPLGRQLTQGNAALGTLTSEYDAAGRRTRLTWPDSYYAAYDFDLYGGLMAVRENGATSGAGVLAIYAYDNLGRRTGVTRGNGVSSTYGYDTVSRLASLSQDPAGTGQDVTISFTHNPAGQIVGRTVSNPAYVFAPNSGATSYVNDDLNRVTSAGGTSITYDTRGNITSGPGGTYGYDAENNLTSAGSTNFAFDPLNRLYGVYGATTTRFLYDGLQVVAEYPATGSTPTARHVPGVGLDDVVTSYAGSGTGTRSWLLADERQSVIGVADASGVAGINAYDEYGVPSSSNVSRFQYTGQMWLPDVGLYHYRARAYAPGLGRFLQTDPIGYGAGANLYAYVGGDPVNKIDPLGLDPCTDFGLNCPVGEVVVRPCGDGYTYSRDQRACVPRIGYDDVIITRPGGSVGSGAAGGPVEQCSAGRRARGVAQATEYAGYAHDSLGEFSERMAGPLAGRAFAPLSFGLTATNALATFTASQQAAEPLDVSFMRTAAPLFGAFGGGVVGGVAGGTAAGALGSVVPVAGTVTGVAVGGTAGAAFGGFLGDQLGSFIGDGYAALRGFEGCD